MAGKRNLQKKQTDIHHKTFAYKCVKVLSDICTTLSYSRVRYSGVEKIPNDGAVIIAPNHCNCLMEPLLILRMGGKEPTVFGARADLFQIPPVAKVLRFLKIVPMVRVRDGIRNVAQNYETMNEVYTVLGDGVPFCLFPEGTHRPMRSLLPLKKGVFRMALDAVQLFKKNVYVVPVGIEYGDYFRYRSTAFIQVGEPINVTQYVQSHQDQSEAQTYRHLLEILSQRISKLITYVPDDERYEGIWSYARIMNAGSARPWGLKERLLANQRTISDIVNAPESELDHANARIEASKSFEKARKRAGISYKSLGYSYSLLRLVCKTAALLIWLPGFLCFCTLGLPAVVTSEAVANTMIKDRAFRNSIRNVINALVTILVEIIWLIAKLFCHASFTNIVLTAVLIFIAPYALYSSYEWFRVWVSDLKLLFNRKLQKQFASIRNM